MQRGAERVIGRQRQPVDHQTLRAELGRACVLRHLEFAADHHLGERLGAFFARVAVADDSSLAQHRGTVTERPDLVELVADIEDRATLARQLGERFKQPFNLLRGQHRGRLVHDQELRILDQTADDLDPLALPDRQRVYMSARMNG